MGSGTHCSKINGFLGTHGTHANGATDKPNEYRFMNWKFLAIYHNDNITKGAFRPECIQTIQNLKKKKKVND